MFTHCALQWDDGHACCSPIRVWQMETFAAASAGDIKHLYASHVYLILKKSAHTRRHAVFSYVKW